MYEWFGQKQISAGNPFQTCLSLSLSLSLSLVHISIWLSVCLHVYTHTHTHYLKNDGHQNILQANKTYLDEFLESSLFNFNRKQRTIYMERPTREFKPFAILLFTHSSSWAFNACKNNIKEFFKISGQEESVIGSYNLLQCLTIGTFKEIFHHI